MGKVNNNVPLEYSTEENNLKIFGFWVFLGAEIMLFGTLFASYFTLVDRTGAGPTGAEIFEITPVLIETFVLLTSSFTIGLAIHAMRLGSKKGTITFMAITLALGLGFLSVEVYEFIHYVHIGAGLTISAFHINFINNFRNTRTTRNNGLLLGFITDLSNRETWFKLSNSG